MFPLMMLKRWTIGQRLAGIHHKANGVNIAEYAPDWYYDQKEEPNPSRITMPWMP